MARVIERGLSFDDVLIIPRYNKIPSRKLVNFRTKVTRRFWIDIPFLAANMDTVCESEMAIALGKLGGLGVIHRFLRINEQANEVKKVKAEGLLCAAAVGLKDYEERVRALVEAGANIIVIDIAHGHSKRLGKVIEWVKSNFPEVDVMAGNIATKDAAEYLFTKGADAVKVGVGPGAVCTTRVMTGVGVPQVTAIMDVYEATRERIPVCADGGIKCPGDVVKAIGAGANTVMCGSVFAGTDETPGKVIEIEGKRFKEFKGMASLNATKKKLEIDNDKDSRIISVEGEEFLVPCKGPVENVVKKYLGGLASGMTYVGAENIDELRRKVDFIEITQSGYVESIARDPNKCKVYF